jgi:H+-translocating NAD(P) transhydrogenase subunit beta
MEILVLGAYGVAAMLFIVSLKLMSEVKTSRAGNWAGAAGMAIGVVATFFAHDVEHDTYLIAMVAIGTAIGVPTALRMPMTAVPQRTAFSHAFGALAAALVGTAELYDRAPELAAHMDRITALDRFAIVVLCAEVILGYLTATGSIVALLKLQEVKWMPSGAVVFPGRHLVSALLLGGSLVITVILAIDPGQMHLFPYLIGASLIFGILLVLAIGGADMPTVIAILNSYAGLSAVGLGFVLNNKLLIVAGALDGSSGLVLAVLMCRAMNRSFLNVLFGGFGAPSASVKGGKQEERPYRSGAADEAAFLLGNADKVVFAPGYGLAVAQAQHAVREVADELKKRGVDVKYAIHPVAGRMPGHMNVLLADANVPYDELLEMDEVNPLFPEVDTVVVVGANDVVNPAARTNKASPLFGMPMLEVDRAKNVIFLKRSMGSGFAGVDNELFYQPNTMMLLGDAKKSLLAIHEALKHS